MNKRKRLLREKFGVQVYSVDPIWSITVPRTFYSIEEARVYAEENYINERPDLHFLIFLK